MVYPILLSILGDAFSNDSFTTETAKQDKIDIDWSGLRLHGNDADGTALLNALTSYRGDEATSARFPDVADQRGAFFNARQGGLTNARVSFRQRDTRYGTRSGVPIIGGEISVRRYNSESHSNSAFAIRGSLSLNPTRFFRHNVDGRSQALQFSDEMLLTKRLPHGNGREYILDENDNCILETTKLRHARPSAYADYRNTYVRGALSFVRERVQRANMLPNSWLSGEEEFNLRRVENYWERACMSAQEYIRGLTDRFLSHRTGFRVNLHNRPSSISRIGNALSLSIPLRHGVDLIVYAKTNLRVRFEVRHQLHIRSGPIGTSHTTRSIDQLLEWLELCASDAAEVLNNNINVLRLPSHAPPFELEHVYSLLHALFDAPGSHDDAIRLLTTLIALESVAGPGSDREIVDHLYSRGVVEPAGRGMFRLSADYVQVARYLRARLSGDLQGAPMNPGAS